jgi:hypothetical protein
VPNASAGDVVASVTSSPIRRVVVEPGLGVAAANAVVDLPEQRPSVLTYVGRTPAHGCVGRLIGRHD